MTETLAVHLLTPQALTEFPSLLPWWAAKTQEEHHLLSLTVADIQETLVVASVMFDEAGRPIAIAGLFEARSRSGQPISWSGRQVLELGSAYVCPHYRQQGLAKQLMLKRLEFARQHGYCPVCVSTNPIIQHLIRVSGGYPISSLPNGGTLKHELCLCKTITPACTTCPFTPEAAWCW